MNLGPLHFQSTTWTLVLGGMVLVTALVLCLVAFSRATRPWRTGSLELLRFLLIAGGVFLLLGPEWRTTTISQTRPEVVILVDDTGSMATEDARIPPGLATGEEKVTTRRDLSDRLLATEFYKKFEENGANQVTLTSFGTPPPAEADLATRTMAGTDLNAALKNVLDRAQNLRSVILISDGDRNLGTPPSEAAQQLRLKGAPLFVIPTGSESALPDLDLNSVTAPTYGIVGENVQIPFAIVSSLPRDVRTIVKIKSDDNVERTKDITIPANDTYYDSVLWKLQKDGPTQLTLSVPVARGELIEGNNERTFVINGKPENIRVLVVETRPRWEYRYIRNALSRDPGVEVDCLLLHPQLGVGDGPDYIKKFPEKLEELQKYDVVFLGDVGIGPDMLTVAQANLIKGLIENQASGVVFIPGSQGHQTSLKKSELADLIPVELDEKQPSGLSDPTPSPMRLTTEGESSLLTMLGDDEEENETIWQSLPGFYWQAAVKKARPGTKVLAVNDNRRNSFGRLPILITSRAGSGKVLYMAIDSAWRWRRGVEDKYHYRFWGQVARWMSYQRNMAAGERIRLYFTPERPDPGDRVLLSANAFSDDGSPLAEGTVVAEIEAPDGSRNRIELTSAGSSWGNFSGSFLVTQPGTWQLKLFIDGEPDTAVTAKIISQADQLEKIGQPVRLDVLKEIASVSRGEVITPGDLDTLVANITNLPEPKPLVSSIKLWAHWLTPVLLISLLALFWTLRKFNGTF